MAPPASKKRKRTAVDAAEGSTAVSRVVYVGHLPHGFYEDQLRGFFSQFGTVTKVRVSRNKKTTGSRHYGFLEFQSAEVAAIAAEAMDGYMMFTCQLRVRIVKQEDVHPNLFKGANRRFAKVPWQRFQAEQQNRERTAEEGAKQIQRLIDRDRRRAERIKAAGIDYQYEPLEAQLPEISKRIVFA